MLNYQRWTGGADDHIVDSVIGIVDLDAKTPAFTPLTTPEMWATYPDWHPTRDLIVFSTRPWRELDEGPSNLYTITPDGAGLAALTDFGPGETRAVQPTWLPDGSGVIFTAVEPFGAADPTMMAVIDADGSGLRPATASGRLFGTHASAAPDALKVIRPRGVAPGADRTQDRLRGAHRDVDGRESWRHQRQTRHSTHAGAGRAWDWSGREVFNLSKSPHRGRLNSALPVWAERTCTECPGAPGRLRGADHGPRLRGARRGDRGPAGASLLPELT